MNIYTKVLTGAYTAVLSLVISVPVFATDALEEKEADEARKASDTENARVTRLAQTDEGESVIVQVCRPLVRQL